MSSWLTKVCLQANLSMYLIAISKYISICDQHLCVVLFGVDFVWFCFVFFKLSLEC